MDSNNNSQNNSELDIRDVASYLVGKLWIIALVVLCFAIIAFLYTSIFMTPVYSSKTDLFIINTTNENAQNASDWSIGKQLTKTSSELILGDYCDNIAELLNNNEADVAEYLGENVKFTDYFTAVTGIEKITGKYIRNALTVTSNDETCIVSVKATTTDPKLSAALSNIVMKEFDAYINAFMKVDTIRTKISASGGVPQAPSNINKVTNMVVVGLVGAVLVCAILIVVFIFDDKIKTPDDIMKQLNLSVLGTIPEIDEA